MITKRKTFILTEGLIEKINKIKERRSLKHEVSVIEVAIDELFKQEYKDYVEIKKQQLSITPLEKATAKQEAQEIEKKLKEDKAIQDEKDSIERGRKICRGLSGKETKDDKGNLMCKYKEVNYINPKNVQMFKREKYMEELSENTLHTQFYNDIEEKIVPKEVCIQALLDNGEKWE